jgi:hypothetical protein
MSKPKSIKTSTEIKTESSHHTYIVTVLRECTGALWLRDGHYKCEFVVSTKTKEYGRRNNAKQIKNEMGGEHSTKWRRDKCVQHSGLRTCEKRNRLGDADVHGEDNIKTDLEGI